MVSLLLNPNEDPNKNLVKNMHQYIKLINDLNEKIDFSKSDLNISQEIDNYYNLVKMNEQHDNILKNAQDILKTEWEIIKKMEDYRK